MLDYWKLYDDYEREEWSYVAKAGIEILKKYFHVSDDTELVKKIIETYGGKDSIGKFEKLLIRLEVLYT